MLLNLVIFCNFIALVLLAIAGTIANQIWIDRNYKYSYYIFQGKPQVAENKV